MAICGAFAMSLANLLRNWLLGILLIVVVPLFVLVGVVYFGVDWLLGTQPAARTMSELARELAQHNVRTFAKQAGATLKREQVWRIVRRELSEVLVVEEEKIHLESDLVKDLLMD